MLRPNTPRPLTRTFPYGTFGSPPQLISGRGLPPLSFLAQRCAPHPTFLVSSLSSLPGTQFQATSPHVVLGGGGGGGETGKHTGGVKGEIQGGGSRLV